MVERGRIRRVRRPAVGRHDIVPEPDVLEVREQPLGRRQPTQGRGAGAERRCEEAARATRIDHEARRDVYGESMARAVERHPAPVVADPFEAHVIQVDRARRLRVLDQRKVEIRPVPMRIGHLVVGARRDEQLARVVSAVGESLSQTMEEECEPSFEAAGHVRPRALPRPPFREGPDLRQVVAIGQLFEQQVGQGRRGLANGEPRMAAAFDEGNATPAPPERERTQCAGEPGAHDRHIHVERERHEPANEAKEPAQ